MPSPNKKLLGFMAEQHWHDLIKLYRRCRGVRSTSDAMRDLLGYALLHASVERLPESPLKDELLEKVEKVLT